MFKNISFVAVCDDSGSGVSCFFIAIVLPWNESWKITEFAFNMFWFIFSEMFPGSGNVGSTFHTFRLFVPPEFMRSSSSVSLWDVNSKQYCPQLPAVCCRYRWAGGGQCVINNNTMCRHLNFCQQIFVVNVIDYVTNRCHPTCTTALLQVPLSCLHAHVWRILCFMSHALQIFIEAKRTSPSILYIPDIGQWWETVGSALRATFLSLLSSIPAFAPILLLATCNLQYAELDEEVWKCHTWCHTSFRVVKPAFETLWNWNVPLLYILGILYINWNISKSCV